MASLLLGEPLFLFRSDTPIIIVLIQWVVMMFTDLPKFTRQPMGKVS